MKMDDNVESILSKYRSEKKKYKNFDKTKNFEILLIKIKYTGNPDKLQAALKELNKSHVVDKKLHKIRNDILGDYDGEFEVIGNISVGDQIRKTHIRFRNVNDDYEAYLNAIDERYDVEDSFFNRYFHKIDTPLFNLVNRSQYRHGCDFKHEIIEYRGNNCFIPIVLLKRLLKAIVLLNVIVF